MATQDTPVLEKEDTLDNFSRDTGAPKKFQGVDSSDEFKSLYKGEADNVTRKGVVASKWDNLGQLIEYVDNDTGNIAIKKTPTDPDHAARLQDINVGNVVSVNSLTELQNAINAGSTVFKTSDSGCVLNGAPLVFKSGKSYTFLPTLSVGASQDYGWNLALTSVTTDGAGDAYVRWMGEAHINAPVEDLVFSKIRLAVDVLSDAPGAGTVTFDRNCEVGIVRSGVTINSTADIWIEENQSVNVTASNVYIQSWKTPDLSKVGILNRSVGLQNLLTQGKTVVYVTDYTSTGSPTLSGTYTVPAGQSLYIHTPESSSIPLKLSGDTSILWEGTTQDEAGNLIIGELDLNGFTLTIDSRLSGPGGSAKNVQISKLITSGTSGIARTGIPTVYTYVSKLVGSGTLDLGGTALIYEEASDSITVTNELAYSRQFWRTPTSPSSGAQFSVKTETSDFTAENNTIHLVETSSADINCTFPDAVDNSFQTRVYKVTSIDTPDIICATTGGQLIGGATSQLIQGSSEGFYLVSHTDHYEIVQDNRGGVQRKNSQSTSIISGYEISQNGADPTKIDIGNGVFSKEVAGVVPTPPATSDISNPVSRLVKTDGVTALSLTGIATDGYTIIQVTDTGSFIQTVNDVPSDESENASPKIAVIVHAGGAILSAESWWTVGQNPSKRVSWLMNKLGILKEGLTVFGAAAGNLQFAHDAGVISYAGADGDKTPNNPDEQPVSAADPVAGFILAKQDAFVNFSQTVIDPTQIDVNGTLTLLTGVSKVSIQRIGINRNGSFTVQYGQNAYASMQDALTAFAEGRDTFTRFNVTNKVSRICAHLIIDRSCTDLTDTATAQFLQTGLLESVSGLSATSELVTILKALQNGNDAGGLQLRNLGDGTISGDAVNKGQLDSVAFKTIYDGVPVETSAGTTQMLIGRATTGGASGLTEQYQLSGTFRVTIENTSGDDVVLVFAVRDSFTTQGLDFTNTSTPDPFVVLGKNWSGTTNLGDDIGLIRDNTGTPANNLGLLFIQFGSPSVVTNIKIEISNESNFTNLCGSTLADIGVSTWDTFKYEMGKRGKVIDSNGGYANNLTLTGNTATDGATTTQTAEENLAIGDQGLLSVGAVKSTTSYIVTPAFSGWVSASQPMRIEANNALNKNTFIGGVSNDSGAPQALSYATQIGTFDNNTNIVGTTSHIPAIAFNGSQYVSGSCQFQTNGTILWIGGAVSNVTVIRVNGIEN